MESVARVGSVVCSVTYIAFRIAASLRGGAPAGLLKSSVRCWAKADIKDGSYEIATLASEVLGRVGSATDF